LRLLRWVLRQLRHRAGRRQGHSGGRLRARLPPAARAGPRRAEDPPGQDPGAAPPSFDDGAGARDAARQEAELPREALREVAMAQALIDAVREAFPEGVESSHSHRGDEVVAVKRDALVQVVGFLRNQQEMKLLRQIACVDLLTFRSETTGGGALASIEAPAYALQEAAAREPVL